MTPSCTASREAFLNRNLDSLNLNFISLLHSSSVGAPDSANRAGSVNAFVKGICSGKYITTQAHSKDKGTIVSVQQQVKPIDAPSTYHKGTV
jgi:hypothetical protein